MPDRRQAATQNVANRAELVQNVTLMLSRERAVARKIHNTPIHSTANEEVHCSALSS